MSTMFLDDASAKALVLLVLAAVSISLIAGSRHQPFPEISGRFGWVLLSLTGLLALGETAPRPMSLTLLLVVALGLGSYGILVGVHHMVRTRRDVFIAPMAGFVFCTGAGGLMVLTWPELNTLEQWAGFLLLVGLGADKPGWCFEGCSSVACRWRGAKPAWWRSNAANFTVLTAPLPASSVGGMPMKST